MSYRRNLSRFLRIRYRRVRSRRIFDISAPPLSESENYKISRTAISYCCGSHSRSDHWSSMSRGSIHRQLCLIQKDTFPFKQHTRIKGTLNPKKSLHEKKEHYSITATINLSLASLDFRNNSLPLVGQNSQNCRSLAAFAYSSRRCPKRR